MKRASSIVGIFLLIGSGLAPLAVLWIASAEGLLLQTMTASDARKRTRQDPGSRERESRALINANLAQAPCTTHAATPASTTVVVDQCGAPPLKTQAALSPASASTSCDPVVEASVACAAPFACVLPTYHDAPAQCLRAEHPALKALVRRDCAPLVVLGCRAPPCT